MAKRFIDTGIFDDDWFMELSKDAKLLWIYMITKCDHAGMIKLNVKLCEFSTGLNSLATVIKELGNRIITVDKHLYFIPKFIEFQYPGFPKSNVNQQSSAIKILAKYGLWDGENIIKKPLINSLSNNEQLINSSGTVDQQLTNCYVNGNGNDNGNEKGLLREKHIEEREQNFISEVSQFSQYPENMIRDFCRYWTEKNKSKTKMRYETEKTFEISKRLITWANRSKDYGTTKTIGADPSELAVLTARKLGIK